MTPDRSAGQAAADYVAVLLVVAVVLAGAATAVAVPAIGGRVVAAVRTGICMVGGDICRSADAAAAGLDPCVTSARSERAETTVDVAVFRLGERGEWQLALQSDGGAVVTRSSGGEGGASVGIGVTFSPLDVEASASATVTAGYRGGRAWRFPDAASAGAFLDAAIDDAGAAGARPPDVRWDAFGATDELEAGVAIADLARVGISAAVDGAIGLRREGARRTLTLELANDLPELASDIPGFPALGGGRRSLVADVSWEHGRARELELRTATAGGDRLEELRGRLDLRDPVSHALAERLIEPGGDTRAELRAVARRMGTHGVVERSGYATSEDASGISVAGRLGVALGLSHQKVTTERRLVDAVARVRGGAPQRRFDCLGV